MWLHRGVCGRSYGWKGTVANGCPEWQLAVRTVIPHPQTCLSRRGSEGGEVGRVANGRSFGVEGLPLVEGQVESCEEEEVEGVVGGVAAAHGTPEGAACVEVDQ